MPHQLRVLPSSLLFSLCAALVVAGPACATSTTPPASFDTGLDPARSASTLTTEDAVHVCEEAADAWSANFDSFAHTVCLSTAATRDTQASCESTYATCIAGLTAPPVFSCQAAGAAAPSTSPLCAQVTIDQIERGASYFLYPTDEGTTPASLCTLPLADRMHFGDLSARGASPTEIAGFECFSGTSLQPVAVP